MESWRFVSGESGFLSEDINSSCPWESRNLCNSSTNMLSTQQQIQNHEFGELGSSEIIDKQVLDNSVLDVLSSKAGNGRITNPVMSFSTSFHKDESISKLPGSVDLKLGRFSKGSRFFSLPESSTLVKRCRRSPVSLQNAICQVVGCNEDLSSSKDYHRRHKVCEIHSKTARVIVNGIEQRFCQQCSRFHLLAEFDDGKRSCRKRLAGHNERRRKPQFGINSGRAGRLLSSYNANQRSLYRIPNSACALSLLSDQSRNSTEIINGARHGLSLANSKNPLSSESRSTINLLQLSSQLQPVETQVIPLSREPIESEFQRRID